MDSRQKLIFDTSGLNGLADDPETTAIRQCIGMGFFVRLTETNIAEVGANSSRERRLELLALCQHLQTLGECVRPYNWIIQEQIKLHAFRRDIYHWQRPQIRSREIEHEVARPEFLTDDDIAEQIREDFRKHEGAFKTLFKDARLKVPMEPEGRKMSVQEMFELSKVDGSPLWAMASDVYEQVSGRRPDELEIRGFVAACPPFELMLLGSCLAQYHYCVREINSPALYKAQRLDLWAAAYLPYCDRFITRDDGQFNALSLLAEYCGLAAKIVYYKDFRSSWLIAA
jgi:hypothetical protein